MKLFMRNSLIVNNIHPFCRCTKYTITLMQLSCNFAHSNFSQSSQESHALLDIIHHKSKSLWEKQQHVCGALHMLLSQLVCSEHGTNFRDIDCDSSYHSVFPLLLKHSPSCSFKGTWPFLFRNYTRLQNYGMQH